MKLLDKIKDLFMDEVSEDDEIELEEENKEDYKEPPRDVLPKVMRDTIKKEEAKIELKVKPEEFVKKEEKKEIIEENVVPQRRFNFPLDFEDELPRERNVRQNSNINVLKVEKEKERKVSELYPKKEEVKEKPKFKATPVISPVYGILDKNYHKDEVKEKTEEVVMKRPSKKVDFETVRKKAFGNLADDIKDNLMCENCELYKEVKKISSLNEDDLLYDLTLDTPSKEELTIEKCYDNYEDFGVSYEKEDVKDIIESEEKEEVNIINNNEIDSVPEKISTKELYEEEEEKIDEPVAIEKQEAKIEDDFFDLVDSMYKERDDE